MKKIILLLILSFACLFGVVACGNTEEQPTPEPELSEELRAAQSYLKQMFEGAAEQTPKDFTRPSNAAGCSVVWTVKVTTGNADDVKITINDKGAYAIDVNEKTNVEVVYVLTATITDKAGNTTTLTYNHKVPQFKELTYTEYASKEKGDAVVVKGIVVGILSKSYGDTVNGLYLHTEEGGYYIYDMAEETVGKYEMGMEVRATGTFDNYNGTLEVKDATCEILNATPVEVTPVDLTEAYKAAADLTAASILGKQAMLVTLKGVTIGTAGDNGYYYFELDGLKTYMRVSSSTCPLNKADTATFEAEWVEHLGWTADITGVVSIYSGNFYLQPCSLEEAAVYKSLPDLNDTDAVAFEKGNLAFNHVKFDENTVLDLPLAGAGYTDVNIVWTSNSEAAVVDAETGKLSITCGEEDVDVVLTATLSRGDAEATATFEFTVKAAAKGVYVAKPIAAPAAGTFVIAMDLTATNQGIRYFDGTLNSQGALVTTDKAANAAQVVVEVVEGGYALKVGDKYLEGYKNGDYNNIRLVDTAAVWGWNEEVKVFTCVIGDKTYYFGDRDRGGYAKDTMALSEIKYVTGDNLVKVGVSQFVGQACTLAPADYKAQPIAAPVAGTFVIAMDLTATNQGIRYFDGTLNSQGALVTTDKAANAAQVVVEVVEGGYALKVGDKYLEGYKNGDYNNIRLVDTAAVWGWNEEVKVFTCVIGDKTYYFGDRDRGGYAKDTMALSEIKYVTGDNLVKVGVSQFVGQACTLVPAEVGALPISAPVAGTFVIAMDLTATNQGVRYFDGTLNSQGALVTTDKLEKAAQVVVEVVEGGYALKVGDKYLEGYKNGDYNNIRLVDNAAVWGWNEEVKVFTCVIGEKTYYFGDRDRGGYAKDTMALSEIKYVTGDNLVKVGVSQFVGQACTIGFVNQITDAERVEADKAALEVVEKTYKDLELPTEGKKGSKITWSSSNTAVIANDGKVVRPAEGSEDAVVTLTATIVYKEVTETVTFEVTVPACFTPDVTNGLSIETYAAAYGWENSVRYASITYDANTTITSTGTASGNYGLNTGKYYTTGQSWRIYQAEKGTVTITSTKTIASVVIEYTVDKGGILAVGETTYASGATIEVNGNTFSFTVGQTGDATNGQVRVSKITVNYAE